MAYFIIIHIVRETLLAVYYLSRYEDKITCLSIGYYYVYVFSGTLQWGLLAHFVCKTLLLASPHAPVDSLEVL